MAKEDIKTVIISAPNNLGCIESQIETNYKHVTKVIDISDLTGPEFDDSTKPIVTTTRLIKDICHAI
jgi:hypothetical protein